MSVSKGMNIGSIWILCVGLSATLLASSSLVEVAAAAAAANRSTDFISSAKNWNGTRWALLVAGSKGYYNYRHQADVCHAFHVLRAHGIPEEKIVVMMYDDIAHSVDNPHPGVLINRQDGPNVYEGVPKDYTGEEVTPEMFTRVLQGDRELAAAGRKVIASGPKDHVFVFFADHGAKDLVAFPNSHLHAQDLYDTLSTMSKRHKFDKLVFYLEACESGSMFDTYLTGMERIFATTASSPSESSYACYWSEDFGVYLGDYYSVNWMEQSDSVPDLNGETLETQFKYVRKETNQSHVKQYGDLVIATHPVAEYQGGAKAPSPSAVPVKKIHDDHDVVSSRDVPLLTAINRLREARDPEERVRWESEVAQLAGGRMFLRSVMRDLAGRLAGLIGRDLTAVWTRDEPVVQKSCYKRITNWFSENCFKLSEHTHALEYLRVLANFCDQIPQNGDEEDLLARAMEVLSDPSADFRCSADRIPTGSFGTIY